MIEWIAAWVGKDRMAPEYRARADALRQRALLESLKNCLTFDPQKGVDLIEATATTAIALPNSRNTEFAMGEDGIAFARIADGKYYPIDTHIPKFYLDWSKYYDGLARSRLRRIFCGPKDEMMSRLVFQLGMLIGEIRDATFQLQ